MAGNWFKQFSEAIAKSDREKRLRLEGRRCLRLEFWKFGVCFR